MNTKSRHTSAVEPKLAHPHPSNAATAPIACALESKALALDAGPFSASGQLIVKTADAVFRLRACRSCRQEANDTTDIAWEGLDVRLQWDAERALRIQLTNTGREPIRIIDLCMRFDPDAFVTPLKAMDYRQLAHGDSAASAGGVKALSLPAAWTQTIAPDSHLYTIYRHDTTGHALLLGALPPFGSAFTSFRTLHDAPHAQGRWGIEIRYDFQQTIPPGGSIRTSPLFITQGITTPDVRPLLDDYAAAMRRRLGRPRKPRALGWNSWDYYAGAVQRKDMDANAQAARDTFGDRLDYIVIDEGYECMWGVWRANWKFPEGLADYCRHVKSLGYRPGIWTAPLMVNAYTPLYREHPDWFISNADGSPHLNLLSYGNMAQLDITQADVRAHLKELYNRLTADGFEYFKVDFTQMALKAPGFADPTVGRADLLRNLFQLIRDCIGPDRYLLSCLAPFESISGIVDAHRITGDIHNHWSHIRHNVPTMFQRLWMGGTIGNIDPDFAIVRSAETTDDTILNRRMPLAPEALDNHWCRGPEMSLEQAKVLALAIHLTGGDLIFSDALPKLNQTGLDILRRLAGAKLTGPARVHNLLVPGRELTPIVSAPVEDGILLGLFNLSDTLVRQAVEFPPDAKLIDFWTGRAIDRPAGPILLPPRSAMGIVCPAFNVPQDEPGPIP